LAAVAVALFLSFLAICAEDRSDSHADSALEVGDGEDFLSQGIAALPPKRDLHTVSGAIQPAGFVCCTPDERVQISDTAPYPVSTVTYLELYDIFGFPLGQCSGTFVGPDSILTAGHCLYFFGAGWVGNIWVAPGNNGFCSRCHD
jgi:V8-like Glu-specific endopeptidase